MDKLYNEFVAEAKSSVKKDPKVIAHWASGDHMYGAVDDRSYLPGVHQMFLKHKGSPNGSDYPVARLHMHGEPVQYDVHHYIPHTEPFPNPLPRFNDQKVHIHEPIKEDYEQARKSSVRQR